MGLFTRTEFLSFDTLSRDHLATNRRPVSYRIRFTTFRSFLANKNFSTKGRGGLALSGKFHYLFFLFLNPSLIFLHFFSKICYSYSDTCFVIIKAHRAVTHKAQRALKMYEDTGFHYIFDQYFGNSNIRFLSFMRVRGTSFH